MSFDIVCDCCNPVATLLQPCCNPVATLSHLQVCATMSPLEPLFWSPAHAPWAHQEARASFYLAPKHAAGSGCNSSWEVPSCLVCNHLVPAPFNLSGGDQGGNLYSPSSQFGNKFLVIVTGVAVRVRELTKLLLTFCQLQIDLISSLWGLLEGGIFLQSYEVACQQFLSGTFLHGRVHPAESHFVLFQALAFASRCERYYVVFIL